MESVVLPILLFVLLATVLSVGLVVLGAVVGPRRSSRVKQMPYESGMDPIHDTRRRFDVRFHLVAVAFLVFDVELLFLYPWAVARKHELGFASGFGAGGEWLVFSEVMVFVLLLALGFVYVWRRGVFQWR